MKYRRMCFRALVIFMAILNISSPIVEIFDGMVDKAEAKTEYIYAWLVSTCSLYLVKQDNGKYKSTTNPDGTEELDWGELPKGSGKETYVYAWTYYSGSIVVSGTKWKNETFELTNKVYTWEQARDKHPDAPVFEKDGDVYPGCKGKFKADTIMKFSYPKSSSKGEVVVNPMYCNDFDATGVRGSTKGGCWGIGLSNDTIENIISKGGNKDKILYTPVCCLELKSARPIDIGGDDVPPPPGPGDDGDTDPPPPGDDDDDDDDDGDDDDGDTDPPPPEPSEAAVSVDLSISKNATMNYMSFNGSLWAEASARDESYYQDEGELESLELELNSFDETETNSGTRPNGSVSARLDKDINMEIATSSSWLSETLPGIAWSFDADAYAEVNLTDGSPRRARDSISKTGHVTLTNDPPSVTWTLRSNPINGKEVKFETVNGVDHYYYVDMPATLNVVWSDPEDDIESIRLEIGRKVDFDNGACNMAYEMEAYDTSTPVQYDVSTALMEFNSAPEMSLTGFSSSSVVFHEEGYYCYRAFIYDAFSNPDLRESAEISGTFYVRPPKDGALPPVAIIDPPDFAFEGEAITIHQSSTDPNGVDDIVKYTWTVDLADVTSQYDSAEASKPGFTTTAPVTAQFPNNGTKDARLGGSAVFPMGSNHHWYLRELEVEDATQLTDSTTRPIKVIANVPVAILKFTDNDDEGRVKENRKITVSAEDSIAPRTDPIIWGETEWKIEPLSGSRSDNIHESTDIAGNKQRRYQFDSPGEYLVTVTVKNDYSKAHPDHEDIAASTATIKITVVEDVVPESVITVASDNPKLPEDGGSLDHTIIFRVSSTSPDNDLLSGTDTRGASISPNYTYVWKLYDDLNGDNEYQESEIIPENKRTYNSSMTEVAIDTHFVEGHHNKVKAVVTTTETFAEPYLDGKDKNNKDFLASDGSYKRFTTVELIEIINWKPIDEIIPEPTPTTPYDNVDVDGDGFADGKFIRMYTDDTATVGLRIVDEIPETCEIIWQLAKKDYDGEYHENQNGTEWINNGNTIHTLGHDGGTIRINVEGIYLLRAIVVDDCGLMGEHYIYLRIHRLPMGVLETNPKYLYYGPEDNRQQWKTKENVRFDLRSNPTIVDDDWGPAWHQMDWSKDNFDVFPLDGQSAKDIHFMNVDYTARYNDQAPDDETVFSGRNSPLGFGGTTSTDIDIIVIAGPLGSVKEGSKYELSNEAYSSLEMAANTLKDQIISADPKYNVSVHTVRAAEETWDSLKTPIVYGYFNGSSNSADPNLVAYTIEGSLKTTFTNNGVGSKGSTEVTGSVAQMNMDEKGRAAQFGGLTILSGYDARFAGDSSVTSRRFKGSCQVEVNNQLVAQVSSSDEWPLEGKQVATIERSGDTWVVHGLNGTVTCTAESNMALKVTFNGDNCGDHLALIPEAWFGIYQEESVEYTHPKSIMSAINLANVRSGSTKFLFYATDKYSVNTPENHQIDGVDPAYVLGTINTTNSVYTLPELVASSNGSLSNDAKNLVIQLKSWLTSNNVHTFVMEPGTNISRLLYNSDIVDGTVIGNSVLGSDYSGYLTTTLYRYILEHTSVTENTQYRSLSFTEPGQYEIVYWGKNLAGKDSIPARYIIQVEEDLAPVIVAKTGQLYYRNTTEDKTVYEDGKYRAYVRITGMLSNRTLEQEEVLYIYSPDEDYIDYSTATVTYDVDNSKVFTDEDVSWNLEEDHLSDLTFTELANDIYVILGALHRRY